MKTPAPQPGQKHRQAGRIWTVAGVFRSLVDGRTRVHLKSPQQPDRRVLVATLGFAYRPVHEQFVMVHDEQVECPAMDDIEAEYLRFHRGGLIAYWTEAEGWS